MPKAYQCFLCDNYFKYKSVYVRAYRDAHGNVVSITIPCKQATYGSIGSTGDDYVCGPCMEAAIRRKGLS